MMNYKGPHLSFIKPGETKLMLKLYQTISVVSEDEERVVRTIQTMITQVMKTQIMQERYLVTLDLYPSG